MEKKFHWLRELPNLAGVIVGIVLTAIGGVMIINTVLKVYVFGFETNSYFNAEEQCTGKLGYVDGRSPIAVPTKNSEEEAQKLTQEEIDECIEKTTQTEKDRYRRQQQERMIDAIGFLAVGIFLWILNRRRKKGEK